MPARLFTAFILYCILSLPQQAQAWGKEGHHIVAEIAFNSLSENARKNLKQCLGATTPEDAATWMDDVRPDKDYDFQKSWHYIYIEKGAGYAPSTDDNIINHINISYRELLHRKTLCEDQAKKDVLILFHLLGDLHQPLHSGYSTDHEALDIQVHFKDKTTSLHWLWDEEIIVDQQISLQSCMAAGNAIPADSQLLQQPFDVVHWMNDARSYLPEVYAFTGDKIGSDYAAKNKKLIEKQLFLAGKRLGAILETIFG